MAKIKVILFHRKKRLTSNQTNWDDVLTTVFIDLTDNETNDKYNVMKE